MKDCYYSPVAASLSNHQMFQFSPKTTVNSHGYTLQLHSRHTTHAILSSIRNQDHEQYLITELDTELDKCTLYNANIVWLKDPLKPVVVVPPEKGL